MKIYPTIYNYIAPYRGPKNHKELSKLITSIKHDIETVKLTAKDHKDIIKSNIKFIVEKTDINNSNIEPICLLEQEKYEYKSLSEITAKLNSIDLKLDQMISEL